jgi:hypothetical protein
MQSFRFHPKSFTYNSIPRKMTNSMANSIRNPLSWRGVRKTQLNQRRNLIIHPNTSRPHRQSELFHIARATKVQNAQDCASALKKPLQDPVPSNNVPALIPRQNPHTRRSGVPRKSLNLRVELEMPETRKHKIPSTTDVDEVISIVSLVNLIRRLDRGVFGNLISQIVR